MRSSSSQEWLDRRYLQRGRGFGRDGQVIPGVGHWLMEEAPKTVIPAITNFVA
jgi:pimeloyl-ACP methyl ester carboxylesterase